MANPNMTVYVTVKKVNPERLACPVKDCTAEGKEENRVDTPFIAGLGPMTVYLCDIHAGELAARFLDKNVLAGVVYWDEHEPETTLPGEAGALYAFIGWLTSRKEVSGPFSSHHEAGQAARLVGEFVRIQGWPEPPEGWHHAIKPFDEDEREALGRAHIDNAKRTKISWTGEVKTGPRMPLSLGDGMPPEDDFPW